MIGQLWHRVSCHAVVRNVQSFGVMEISKSKEPGHVDIAVPAIQMGEYNHSCGTGFSVDLRLHADLASFFENLEHQFPWANHKPLQLNRFQAGFEEVLRDEPLLEFESPDDLISLLLDYLQEHKSVSPRPLLKSYNPGHGDIATLTTLRIHVGENATFSVELSETKKQFGTKPGTVETSVQVTRKSASCDTLLRACGECWIPGLRIAVFAYQVEKGSLNF